MDITFSLIKVKVYIFSSSTINRWFELNALNGYFNKFLNISFKIKFLLQIKIYAIINT